MSSASREVLMRAYERRVQMEHRPSYELRNMDALAEAIERTTDGSKVVDPGADRWAVVRARLRTAARRAGRRGEIARRDELLATLELYV